MFLYSDLSKDFDFCDTSIALGNFDGIHKGHREVICSAASHSGLTSCVLTFQKHTLTVINGDNVSLLTTDDMKKHYCRQLGIQVYINLDFRKVVNLNPTAFVKLLKEKFHVKKLSCGYNFRFGKNREGNASLLSELCRREGISVDIIPPVYEGEEPVSSSRIREAIRNGSIKKANILLGHNFSFKLEVISGDQRGRLLGAPTINQRWPDNLIKPKFGVYAAHVKINDKQYKAVTNIGVRPTVGTDYVISETYILDFKGDLYGQDIYVELIDFLRPEQKFGSLDELKQAIKSDAEKVRDIKTAMH